MANQTMYKFLNRDRPKPEKHRIGLLISVRNASEARIANDHRIDILDIKEPIRGSLGRPDTGTVNQILPWVDGGWVSVALGELVELSTSTLARFFDDIELSQKIRFAKLGLSKMKGHKNWPLIWEQAISCLPEHVAPVAAAYVDRENAGSPKIEQIFEIGREFGCRMALLDTFDKSGSSFLDHDSMESFIRYRQLANSLQMGFVLAGSVGIASIEAVRNIGPQFVGIRGAVCSDQDRESTLDAHALSNFSEAFRSQTTLD